MRLFDRIKEYSDIVKEAKQAEKALEKKREELEPDIARLEKIKKRLEVECEIMLVRQQHWREKERQAERIVDRLKWRITEIRDAKRQETEKTAAQYIEKIVRKVLTVVDRAVGEAAEEGTDQ
jgi:hypothetical protein